MNNLLRATARAFGMGVGDIVANNRNNGSSTNNTLRTVDARATVVYIMRNSGLTYRAAIALFNSQGLSRSHGTLVRAYYNAADHEIQSQDFRNKLSQIHNTMAIACIPNGNFFLTERCDGCCITDNCEEKIEFSDTDNVRKNVKESLLLCLAACNRAGLDIDVIFSDITDADIAEAARKIIMAEVK